MKIAKKLLFQILKVSFIPVVILASVIGMYTYYVASIKMHLSEEFQVICGKILFMAIALAITIILNVVITAVFEWYKFNIKDKTSSTLDDELLPLFSKVSKIVLWIIAMITMLSKLGFNINALVATIGVGSLAIALAAQDTIANVISGFLLMIDRPFRIGDVIKLPSGEKVKSLDIGVRRSKFLAEDNSVVIMPNVDLSKSKIINFSYGDEIKKKSR